MGQFSDNASNQGKLDCDRGKPGPRPIPFLPLWELMGWNTVQLLTMTLMIVDSQKHVCITFCGERQTKNQRVCHILDFKRPRKYS